MLASPPARSAQTVTGLRHARFSERLSRQLSPSMDMSSLLLDSATIEKHQMANGFGSGSRHISQNAVSSRESSPPRVTRLQSQDFYFSDGNVVFLVERTLYRIHRSVLGRNSPFFRNLFAISASAEGKDVEGSSDENPLHLPHILVDQFDAFLSTVYPNWRPLVPSTDALINILCLATKWEFASTRSYAIELLTSRSLSPVLRIELARAYDIPSWLLASYVELARLRTPLNEADADRLGLPTLLRLGRAREAILRQRFTRALEMPKNDFFDIPATRHVSCWRSMAKSLFLALKNGERAGGSDEDLLDDVLAASRRLQDDEPLCQSCSDMHLFRARCSRWLDIDGDAAIVANIFNL
ncbi:hypothetical protein FRB91_003380 [Serendipita sp. 411]|nr:hypothetical protein FRC15_010629 [Serendipita sp. 397]KAG8821107.1 hypothetical protein FRC19_008263 [Serendipita sp. 401]KAG8829967.1 hypothetical protein FRC18_008828 [Serendipita sp. 400]KAG8854526.1 hypothetical protein FRB91_003380 [Serendipita sp. 411]KAG9053783.1 hypothetical protein FS842_007161 [Serendipita sp. 407]